MNDADFELLSEHIAGLQQFINDVIPPLIAASSARAQLEAQLEAVAALETSDQDDPALHQQAMLAEEVLRRLKAG